MLALHTAADVAATFGRPVEWVLDQARAGLLPGRKLGRQWRFTDADIADYLDAVRTTQERTRTSVRRRRSA